MLSAAAVALAMNAPAQAANAYVSLFGGASFLEKPGIAGVSHTHTTTTLFFSNRASVDTGFKTGFVVGGNWGVDWGTFRTELELAYRSNQSGKTAHLMTAYSVNGYAFDGPTYYTRTNDAIVPASLRLSAYSLMANAWYDFHDILPYKITPYIGGGIGGALVKISGHLSAFDGHDVLTDFKLNAKNSFVFAYQVGAGFSVPVSEDLKLFLDYRYFRADGAQLKLSPALLVGGRVKGDFNSHSVLLGLRIDL